MPRGEDVFEPMVGMEDNSTKIWQLSIKASVNVWTPDKSSTETGFNLSTKAWSSSVVIMVASLPLPENMNTYEDYSETRLKCKSYARVKIVVKKDWKVWFFKSF